MHRTSLFTGWVKNVNRLWVEGVVNRVNLYTGAYTTGIQQVGIWVQAPSFTQVVDTFPPTLYTANFDQLTDKNYRLSTLSTAPIIKKER